MPMKFVKKNPRGKVIREFSRGQFGYRKLLYVKVVFLTLSILTDLKRRNLPEAGIRLFFQI